MRRSIVASKSSLHELSGAGREEFKHRLGLNLEKTDPQLKEAVMMCDDCDDCVTLGIISFEQL